MGRSVKVSYLEVAGKWFGAFSFQSTLSTENVRITSNALQPLITELLSLRYLLYFTRSLLDLSKNLG